MSLGPVTGELQSEPLDREEKDGQQPLDREVRCDQQENSRSSLIEEIEKIKRFIASADETCPVCPQRSGTDGVYWADIAVLQQDEQEDTVTSRLSIADKRKSWLQDHLEHGHLNRGESEV